jgi:hypothetical protein
MQLKPKSAVAVVATVAAGLVPAAGASAATLRGVVVHEDGHAHSFVLAGPHGRLSAIHARHLPALGRSAVVSARHLRNDTWVAQHVQAGRVTTRVRLRATVTYVNPRHGTFVLSTPGASVLVHERARARRHGVLLAADTGVQDGEVVAVEGDLERGAVDASSIHDAGEQSSGISLEGTVQAIDNVGRKLSVSADDDDQSGAVVTVQVPNSFDLEAFTTGEPVELTVSRNPDRTYTLEQSSDDASAAAADNLDDIQGDDHGGEHANAARQCAAQEADPGFPAAHGGLTFTQFYERNPSDAENAFGRCVNLTAHQAERRNEREGSETGGSGSEGSDSDQATAGAAGGETEVPGDSGSGSHRADRG